VIGTARAALGEFLGSAGLAAVVVGSGIAAQRLSPGDVGLQLFENAFATSLGLTVLILVFVPVSGAHFNPVVTLADRVLGGISTRDALGYIPAQVLGGCLGAMAANVMFDLDAVNVSDHARSSGALWFSEVIATMGLLLVILGVVRSGKAHMAPFAVGAYIASAYWFTSSTSFANPAVTIARTLSDTFAGIKPSSVPAFVVAQLIGGALAVVIACFLHPGDALRTAADDVVVPHEPD
jgi:glycerol uptake facilitator-like aquaporin